MDSSRHYFDAKPSFIETDNPLEPSKPNSHRNMFDFERAKQKFDNHLLTRSKTSSSSHKTKSGGSSSHKRSGGVYVPENLLMSEAPVAKPNFNETVQFFDENIRNTKRDSFTNKAGVNLDGLKVSEDDEDVSN